MSLKIVPGDKFNHWTVLSVPGKVTSHVKVSCICDCGTPRDVVARNLLKGFSKSCGHCLQAPIGKVYGHLLVLSGAHVIGKARYVTALCECGKQLDVIISELLRGHRISCGCHPGHYTHRQSKSPLYKVWTAMKSRCRNSKNPRYKDYGGRSITVCDEWQEFEPFQEWALSHGYKEGLSLDRINNNGNYYPINCRWTTDSIQQQNKRKMSSNTSGFIGVSRRKSTSRFEANAIRGGKKVHLGYFDTAIEAAHVRDAFVKQHYESPTLNFATIVQHKREELVGEFACH